MFNTYKAIKDLEKKGKFTEEQAASIVDVISDGVENNIATLATKQDLAMLENNTKQEISLVKIEVGTLRKDLQQEIEILRKETKQDNEILRRDMTIELEKIRTEIVRNHSNLVKWLIGVGLTIGASMISLVFYIIKYMPVAHAVVHNLPH